MEPYGVRYADVAVDDLVRLNRAAKPVYKAAQSMIGLAAENPDRVGHDLEGEWAGCRALHFFKDAYRLIWEVDSALERINVLRVAKRDAQGRQQLYDQPRPASPA